MFEAYGASAFPSGLEVVHERLADHTFDGEENPLGVIEAFKLDEVQKYLSISNHVYTPIYLVADYGKFINLPPRVRAILENTALDMQDWDLERGEELDRQSIQRLEKNMTVNEIDPLAFTLPSLKIYKEFTEAAPQCKSVFKTIFELTPPYDYMKHDGYVQHLFCHPPL